MSINLSLDTVLYEEIGSTGRKGQVLVRDRASQQILLKKMLSNYNRNVYTYLKEHPSKYVPKVYDIFEQEGQLIVIEELVSGQTLDYILENQTISEVDKVEIIREICRGLIVLHSASPQIIHRDLKATNIMITADGQLKIIDYDAAKTFKKDASQDTVLMGTHGFAAPEQYGFGQSDARTDIYALGILMKWMLEANTQYQRIIAKATMLDPKDRYQTAQEMLMALGGTHEENPAMSGSIFYKKDAWINVPGFRTKTPWKMFVAIFGYLLLLDFAFASNLTIPDGTTPTLKLLIIDHIVVFGLGLSTIDLFTNWLNVFPQLPWLKAKNRILRWIGYGLTEFGMLFLWVIVDLLLEEIL